MISARCYIDLCIGSPSRSTFQGFTSSAVATSEWFVLCARSCRTIVCWCHTLIARTTDRRCYDRHSHPPIDSRPPSCLVYCPSYDWNVYISLVYVRKLVGADTVQRSRITLIIWNWAGELWSNTYSTWTEAASFSVDVRECSLTILIVDGLAFDTVSDWPLQIIRLSLPVVSLLLYSGIIVHISTIACRQLTNSSAFSGVQLDCKHNINRIIDTWGRLQKSASEPWSLKRR